MLAVARMYNSSLGQIAGTTTNNCDHSVHRAKVSIDCVCVCFRRAEVSANVGGKWKKKERKKERKKKNSPQCIISERCRL